MSELPLWPPLAALAFVLVGYAVLWYLRRRLDREEEVARQKQHPAD
jgi:hypothetical protein